MLLRVKLALRRAVWKRYLCPVCGAIGRGAIWCGIILLVLLTVIAGGCEKAERTLVPVHGEVFLGDQPAAVEPS